MGPVPCVPREGSGVGLPLAPRPRLARAAPSPAPVRTLPFALLLLLLLLLLHAPPVSDAVEVTGRSMAVNVQDPAAVERHPTYDGAPRKFYDAPDEVGRAAGWGPVHEERSWGAPLTPEVPRVPACSRGRGGRKTALTALPDGGALLPSLPVFIDTSSLIYTSCCPSPPSLLFRSPPLSLPHSASGPLPLPQMG